MAFLVHRDYLLLQVQRIIAAVPIVIERKVRPVFREFLLRLAQTGSERLNSAILNKFHGTEAHHIVSEQVCN